MPNFPTCFARLYSVSLPPDSEVAAASFSKRSVNLCAQSEMHAHIPTKTKVVCMCLHAASLCLRHCQEEEKGGIVDV